MFPRKTIFIFAPPVLPDHVNDQPIAYAYIKFVHIKGFTASNFYVKVLFSQNSLVILSFLKLNKVKKKWYYE